MKKRLIILSDYGLDDAVASVYLLDNREMFGEIDLLSIGGNTSIKNSYNNIVKLISAYAGLNGMERLEGVRIIDTAAVEQFCTDLPSIHGVDGMGDCVKAVNKSVVDVVAYSEWFDSLGDILADDEPCILLSLGPCTITNYILDEAVRLNKIDKLQLIIMAGVTNHQPNFGQYEFNQAMDVDGFNKCVGFKHVIATLDTCRDAVFNLADKRVKGDSIFATLVNAAEILAEARHPDNCYIYDFIAAHYITCPNLFTVNEVTDKWGNRLSELKVISDKFKEATDANKTGFSF